MQDVPELLPRSLGRHIMQNDNLGVNYRVLHEELAATDTGPTGTRRAVAILRVCWHRGGPLRRASLVLTSSPWVPPSTSR